MSPFCAIHGLCLFSTMIWFSSFSCDIVLYVGDSNGKIDSMRRIHQIKIMIVDMMITIAI